MGRGRESNSLRREEEGEAKREETQSSTAGSLRKEGW